MRKFHPDTDQFGGEFRPSFTPGDGAALSGATLKENA